MKFFINIVAIKADNSPAGPNFNIPVEAADYVEALEKGKDELLNSLEAVGLQTKAKENTKE